MRFRPSITQISSARGQFYVAEQDYIARVIMETGAWEPHLYAFAALILDDGSNIIDLGANFGYHTVGMARMVPNGSVFAFEPQSLFFSQLQLNILTNALRNVVPFKLAVSDQPWTLIEMDPLEATMNADGGVNLGNTGIGAGGDFAFTARLDDLPFPKIAFLKIDIQGAELSALIGMRNLILRDRPVFFIEIEEHHLQCFGTSSKALIDHLLALDYSLVRINTDWPTDHMAIPNERPEIISRCLQQGEYKTDLLSGSSVELRFENRFFYAGFTTS